MDDNIQIPSIAQAAALLVDASAFDAETDRGETVELWTIASEGAMVTASGPRLSVAAGMAISCRLAHGGQPVEIRAVIEDAEYRSPSRASLVLRVVEVAAHGYRRGAERLSVNSSASLRAVRCERVVEHVVIPVTLTDLSDAGCAVTMTDSRPREGDRMALTARFVEGEVTVDVRIVHLHSPTPGIHVAGCRFIDATAADSGVLSQVLARLAGHARPAADIGSIRDELGEGDALNSLKAEAARADEAYWTSGKRPAARFHQARRAF